MMPRKARIDAPGALHHVIIRGIERRKIFRSDYDRQNFITRLVELIPESKIDCYAWALLSNHCHFLLKTGSLPLSVFMSRLPIKPLCGPGWWQTWRSWTNIHGAAIVFWWTKLNRNGKISIMFIDCLAIGKERPVKDNRSKNDRFYVFGCIEGLAWAPLRSQGSSG